jgi:hypothetical protein
MVGEGLSVLLSSEISRPGGGIPITRIKIYPYGEFSPTDVRFQERSGAKIDGFTYNFSELAGMFFHKLIFSQIVKEFSFLITRIPVSSSGQPATEQ